MTALSFARRVARDPRVIAVAVGLYLVVAWLITGPWFAAFTGGVLLIALAIVVHLRRHRGASVLGLSLATLGTASLALGVLLAAVPTIFTPLQPNPAFEVGGVAATTEPTVATTPPSQTSTPDDAETTDDGTAAATAGTGSDESSTGSAGPIGTGGTGTSGGSGTDGGTGSGGSSSDSTGSGVTAPVAPAPAPAPADPAPADPANPAPADPAPADPAPSDPSPPPSAPDDDSGATPAG